MQSLRAQTRLTRGTDLSLLCAATKLCSKVTTLFGVMCFAQSINPSINQSINQFTVLAGLIKEVNWEDAKFE